MKKLLSTTNIADTDLSIRAMNIIRSSLPFVKDITIATIMDNKQLIFDNRNCHQYTKNEINTLLILCIL